MAKTKFDIKTDAIRPLYAGVGVTDLAVEVVRGYVTGVQTRVADVQKNVTERDFQPQALREQAVTVVSDRVQALSKDAKARREAIERQGENARRQAKERQNDSARQNAQQRQAGALRERATACRRSPRTPRPAVRPSRLAWPSSRPRPRSSPPRCRPW